MTQANRKSSLDPLRLNKDVLIYSRHDFRDNGSA